MRATLRRIVPIGLTAALFAPMAASACPVCHGETGQQVRAGIFGQDFASTFFASVLPFPIFLGIVAAIHGLPAGGRGARRSAPGSSLEPR